MAALTEHQHDELLIPMSVYAEILVAPYRRGADAVAEVEAFLRDFSVRAETISPATARAAAKLHSGARRLRLPDALGLATADELEAPAVLTGDESCARLSSRVTVVRRS